MKAKGMVREGPPTLVDGEAAGQPIRFGAVGYGGVLLHAVEDGRPWRRARGLQAKWAPWSFAKPMPAWTSDVSRHVDKNGNFV